MEQVKYKVLFMGLLLATSTVAYPQLTIPKIAAGIGVATINESNNLILDFNLDIYGLHFGYATGQTAHVDKLWVNSYITNMVATNYHIIERYKIGYSVVYNNFLLFRGYYCLSRRSKIYADNIYKYIKRRDDFNPSLGLDIGVILDDNFLISSGLTTNLIINIKVGIIWK